MVVPMAPSSTPIIRRNSNKGKGLAAYKSLGIKLGLLSICVLILSNISRSFDNDLSVQNTAGMTSPSSSFFGSNKGSSTKQWFDSCIDNGNHPHPEHHEHLVSKRATNTRWSERSSQKSHVQSIFNCDSSDSPCKYYYPGNFFNPACGLGRKYIHHIYDAKAMMANNTLWANMPNVGFPTLTMANVCLNKTQDALTGEVETLELVNIGEHIYENDRCMTERISMIHVHKSGGTSLHAAMDYIDRNFDGTKQVRHRFFTPPKTPPKNFKKGGNMQRRPAAQEITTQSENNTNGERVLQQKTPKMPKTPKAKGKRQIAIEQFTLDSLDVATKYPVDTFSSDDHVIFAVVRDPTERFISSIGQAMGGEGSQHNLIGKTLQEVCIKETSAATLKCMAKYVRDHGFWIELHFTPQVLDLSFTIMWQDVPVALFPFKSLPKILEYLGSPERQGRKGNKSNYRPDEVLTKMSVEDYDEETLEIVCNIYEMDVIMQRSMGIEVPRCDPYISK